MQFSDLCTCPSPVELHKRVLYSHGLVLGVGELKTEQNFMLGHHYAHNRRLHGYGTGAGLRLEIKYLDDGPECVVHPGWGVDPQGHDICVHEAQCAKLNQWLLLQQQAGDLSSPLDTSGTANVEAYVVLCYRECETDKVPIPVGPCLSLDKAMVPSRIEESFELQLLAEPPVQAEEDAIRRLGDILSRVSIAGSGGMTTPDALVAEIRALADAAAPIASIPSIPADFALAAAQAEEILQVALRVFVTEVRPLLVPEGGPCLNGPRTHACLLLGRLAFDVTPGPSGPEVVPDSIIIDERNRPLLLSTRVLEEAVLSNMLPGIAGTSDAPVMPTPGAPLEERRAAGPAILSLLPSSATPNGPAAVDSFAGIPSLRFRRNGAAMFAFRIPAGLSASAPVRLRLHWAFRRPSGSADMSLNWEAALRLQSSGAVLSDFSSPAPQAVITTLTPAASIDRLLTTDFATLPRGTSADPAIGFLNLALRTAAALPAAFEIHLISAELAFTIGSGS
jgi:hypothetical protein